MNNYNKTYVTIQTHRPLREMVYEELKDRIVMGEILPGTRLMEVQLAQEMDVSRTPIREAIRKLEKEGLVMIEPRKGAYAAEISLEDMAEMLEVCQNAEGLAAFFAASRMTKKQKKALEYASSKYNAAACNKDIAAMIKYDEEFHRIIAESSNNKYLFKMLEQLNKSVFRFRNICCRVSVGSMTSENLTKENMAILEAIDMGDPEAARDAVAAYIDRLKKQVISVSVQ